MMATRTAPARKNAPAYSRVSRTRIVDRHQRVIESVRDARRPLDHRRSVDRGAALRSAPRTPQLRSGHGPAGPGSWPSGAPRTVSSDAVSDARDGLDQWWVAQLAAQHHDGEPDHAGERVGVLVPGLLQQLFGGHRATVAAQQFGEH